MTIHRRIKEQREQRGLSMQALATLVGVKAWQTIQQWEKEVNGTAPKRDRLKAVADALGTTQEYLLFGDVSATKPTKDQRISEAPPERLPTKKGWGGLPDGPAMDAALQDWRARASPKSREVIDSLIERARNNDFTDQQWEIFLWLAEKYSRANG
jgi:transcriptional regulator with XRE-family HTH domain